MEKDKKGMKCTNSSPIGLAVICSHTRLVTAKKTECNIVTKLTIPVITLECCMMCPLVRITHWRIGAIS